MDNEAVYCHEYVSLRLAKILKEKRYLIPTNHYYKEGKLLSCISIKEGENVDKICSIHNITNDYLAAPKLVDVQEWLKVRYNVYLHILPREYNNKYRFGYECVGYKYDLANRISNRILYEIKNSYKEVLEECIIKFLLTQK